MLNKVISFLKNPIRPEEQTPISVKDFSILLFLTLIVIIPYALVLDQIDMSQFDNIMEEFLEKYKWLVVIGAIILAPILEEPAFRMHLDYKKNSIYWGIGLSILFISQLWFIAVAYMGYLFFILMKIKDNEPPKLKLVIFLSAAFFGLVHLGNYKDFDWIGNFYFIPVLVGAQFILGLILSYVRLHHGMKACMLFHGAYNAIILVPFALFGDM